MITDEKLKYNVAVIGSGSWATAIVKILTANLERTSWWVRKDEIVEGIQKYGHNPRYLSSTFINPDSVEISTDLEGIASKAEYLVIVTPAAFLHESLKPLKNIDISGKKIITAVKGIIPETMQLISDYLHNEFNIPLENMSMISGPSHAEEIAQEKYTFLTAVSLGAGIYSGLGYGDNFLAAYIANCVNEMKNFVESMYPGKRNLNDSVYLGDLLVTAYSRYSRNRLFGNMIGHGLSVRVAQLEMNMIAEGYYACRCVHEINKRSNFSIPIAETIYGILYEAKNVNSEMKNLAENYV